MRNQKEINVAKFERLSWRQREGMFTAYASIWREPLGMFYVDFKLAPTNGKTTVKVTNSSYGILNMLEEVEYENFQKAVEGVKEYFDKIDGIVKSIPSEIVARADATYRSIIAQSVGKILHAS